MNLLDYNSKANVSELRIRSLGRYGNLRAYLLSGLRTRGLVLKAKTRGQWVGESNTARQYCESEIPSKNTQKSVSSPRTIREISLTVGEGAWEA